MEREDEVKLSQCCFRYDHKNDVIVWSENIDNRHANVMYRRYRKHRNRSRCGKLKIVIFIRDTVNYTQNDINVVR